MRKLLLIIATLIVGSTCYAQDSESTKLFRIKTAEGKKYFDKNTGDYLTKPDFVSKYGVGAFADIKEDAIRQRWNTTSYDRVKNQNAKYMESQKESYTIKMRPKNVIIGSALIGTSVAAYAITYSALSGKINSLSKDLSTTTNQMSELNLKYSNNQISKADYTKSMEQLTADSNSYSDRMNSAQRGQRIAGYVCGGVSIAGVICIITGIYKEKNNGMPIAENWSMRDNGAGLSLTRSF